MYSIIPHVYKHILFCHTLSIPLFLDSGTCKSCPFLLLMQYLKTLLLHPFLQFVVWLLAHLLYCLLPLAFSFTHPFIHLWIIAPLSDVDFLYYVALSPLYTLFTQDILDLLDSILSVFLLQILIFPQQPLKFATCLFLPLCQILALSRVRSYGYLW